MAQSQNFRTAFNGFNREDVVQYLSFLNTKHAAEVSQLSNEAEELRRELAEAEKDTQLQERVEELEMQLAQSETEKASLILRVAELERELANVSADVREVVVEKPVYIEKVVERPMEVPAQVSSAAQELEAYRRAERAERVAKERATVIYNRANGVLSDATEKVDGAADQISVMAERTIQQIQQLQQAVMNSRYALQEAVSEMYALRPELEAEKD